MDAKGHKHKKLKQAFWVEEVSITQTHQWYKRSLKGGRTSTEDNKRLGPTISKNEENIQNVGK